MENEARKPEVELVRCSNCKIAKLPAQIAENPEGNALCIECAEVLRPEVDQMS